MDSGTSKHYMKINSPLQKIHCVNDGERVVLPNGEQIVSTHRGSVPIPTLSPQAREAHVFPGLTQSSLISISQLCDDGCDVNFKKNWAYVYKNKKLIMKGKRNFRNGMYEINLTNINKIEIPRNNPIIKDNTINQSQLSSNVYHITKTKEVIEYLHRCCFSPKISTWCDAIDNGFFSSWPHLTSKLVRKHLQEPEATIKGHQHRSPKNLRSTKPKPEFTTVQATKNVTIIPQIQEIDNKLYTDQTGKFPHRSSNGNLYIMVIYVYEANGILAAPLKNRTGSHLLETYQQFYKELELAGFKPKLHIIDNEASTNFKQFLKAENVHYQLVPPHTHRRNAAERAIQTFKNHFVSGLCSVDTNFPLHLWDRLLPQAVVTLNLLRSSRFNPKLSAYQQLFGNFNFNNTPLAPPGTKILIHETPDVRQTWAPHSVDGWYIGPALEHYRCYRCYVPTTRRERISDTVEFFLQNTEIPFLSSKDLAAYAALDLIAAIKNPSPETPLFVGDEQLRALTELAEIFASSVYNKIIPANPASPRLGNQNPSRKPRVKQRTPTNEDGDIDPPETTRYNLRSRANHLCTIKDFDIQYANSIMNKAFSFSTDSHLTPFLSSDPYDYEFNTTSLNLINAIYHPDTGEAMTYRKLIKDEFFRETWLKSFANELGRLSKGVGSRIPNGTNTIRYIKRDEMPNNRTATYGKVVCKYKPHKFEKNRARLVVGGDKVDYPFEVSTPTSDITSLKCLINSVLSTPNAKFLSLDIRDFYLETPMKRPEYMKLPIDIIPQEIIDQYNLLPLVHTDNHVYLEITKGMYGLPQAGRIANDQLREHLEKHGYVHSNVTNGLWTHKTRDTVFTLVVDDFAVKYTSKENIDHLFSALKEIYRITIDWEGKHFIGIDLNWDYDARTCELSMPDYVRKALERFMHKHTKKQHAPSKYIVRYGTASQQSIPPPPDEPEISAADDKFIQQVVGTFLYYGRCVDPTVLHALSAIGCSRKFGMKQTLDATIWLLNYLATHPNAVLRYTASDKILFAHSDASYMTETEARSQAGGHFFLSSPKSDPNNPPTTEPDLNGPILSECSILRHVMSSAAEAEIAALYVNAKNAEMLRQNLIEMVHPQPPTPLQTDNTTARDIVTNTVKQRKTRAMDMRFYWLRDRRLQRKYHIYWGSSVNNLGDYYTKHHPPVHHQKLRPSILNCNNVTTDFNEQGCINPSNLVRTGHVNSAGLTGLTVHHCSNYCSDVPTYVPFFFPSLRKTKTFSPAHN